MKTRVSHSRCASDEVIPTEAPPRREVSRAQQEKVLNDIVEHAHTAQLTGQHINPDWILYKIVDELKGYETKWGRQS